MVVQTRPSAKLEKREPSFDGKGYHVSAEVERYAPKRPEKDTPEKVSELVNGQSEGGEDGHSQGTPGHVPFGTHAGRAETVLAARRKTPHTADATIVPLDKVGDFEA